MFDKYNKNQLEKIKTVMKKLSDDGIKPQNTEMEYLKQYLNMEEIALFYKMMADYYYDKMIKNKNIQVDNSFELKWEVVTPYKTLGIEEREYSNEELLKAVAIKIKVLKSAGKHNEIDKILDAYNEIKKTSNKKR